MVPTSGPTVEVSVLLMLTSVGRLVSDTVPRRSVGSITRYG